MATIDLASAPRPAARLLILSALLLIGGALRCYNLDYGLPESFHPDERTKLNQLRGIVRGDLVLEYLRHPSFMLYTAGAFAKVTSVVTGAKLDDRSLLRAARLWIAIVGTASIAIAYAVTRRLTREPIAALVAAALLALSPLPLVLSHHVKEDVPLTFWLLVALIPLTAMVHLGRRRDYLAMGAVVGMATATKYIGALMLLVPVVVLHVLGRRAAASDRRASHRARDLGLLVLVAGAVFTAWNFSILLGPDNFTRDIGREMDRLEANPLDSLSRLSLEDRDLTPVLLVVTALALLVTVRRSPVNGRLLAIVTSVWFLCGALCPLPGGRYALPFHGIVPIVLAVGAFAVDRRRVWLARLAALVVGGMLVVETIDSVVFVRAMVPDTPLRARDHIEQNVPPGSRILFVGRRHTVPRLSMLSVLMEEVVDPSEGLLGEGADYLLTSLFSHQRLGPRLESEEEKLERLERWRAPSLHDHTHNPRITLHRLPRGDHETRPEPCEAATAAEAVSAVFERRRRSGMVLTEFSHDALPEHARAELVEVTLSGARLRWTYLVPDDRGSCLVLLGSVERLLPDEMAIDLRAGTLTAARGRALIEASYRLSFAATSEKELPRDVAAVVARGAVHAERDAAAATNWTLPIERLLLRFVDGGGDGDDGGGVDVRHVWGMTLPIDESQRRPLGLLEARALLVVEAMRHVRPGPPGEQVLATAAERLSRLALEHPRADVAELCLALLTRCWASVAPGRRSAVLQARRLESMLATLGDRGMIDSPAAQ